MQLPEGDEDGFPGWVGCLGLYRCTCRSSCFSGDGKWGGFSAGNPFAEPQRDLGDWVRLV